MKKLLNLATGLLACATMAACGGTGSSSASSGGGGGGPTPLIIPGVNIGNIAAIPLSGNQTTTSLVVTNNASANLSLVSANISQGTTVTPVSMTSDTSSSSFGLINATQCAILQSGGTCSVSITPPKQAGQYLLTMNYTTGSKTYSTSQVVVFSNTIAPANGFTYSNLNNNLYNAPGGSTTYAIPFVLDNSYTSLYAYSNNPAFATSFSCPGGTSYSKGDLCTAYVRVANLGSNPDVTALVTVSTFPDPHPVTKTNLPSLKSSTLLDGATGYSFNTQVSVANNVTGNLVSSAFNIVVSPSNGSVTPTVTLLNNGSATVSGITITPVGGIISIVNSGAGSCAVGVGGSNSLTAGSSCTFNVSANTLTSGSGSVNITYNNGGTGNTNGTLPFTVVYISAAAGPGLSMTAGQGSLQNSVVGFTSALNLQVTNTGNIALSNISFTNITNVYGSQFQYDSASTCATNGTQSLPPLGGQCTLIVDYLPTVAVASTPFSINQTASYLDTSGNPLTYSGAVFTTNYSAFLSNAFVYLTPNSVSYAVRADNADTTVPQVITVANFGGQAATLSSPSYTLSAGLSSISSTIHITDGCAGVSLTPNNGNTCNITVVYGPVAAAQSALSGYLNVAYQPVASIAGTVTAFSAQSFQAQVAALVSVSGPSKTGASGGGGAGTSISAYTFYNSAVSGSPIVLTYTYTNSGTATATGFNVNLNNLPLGWTVSSATCGYGGTSTSLTTATPCTVAITAISPATFWNPYSSTAAINVVTPSFSYTDTNTGLNTGPAAPTTTYVTPLLFATVSANNLTHATATAGGVYNVTFTASAGLLAQFPVTVTIPSTSLPVGAGTPIYLTTANSCTISTLTGNCTISITNVAGAAPAAYNYQYWITPTGLTPSASNSIIQYFGFTLN